MCDRNACAIVRSWALELRQWSPPTSGGIFLNSWTQDSTSQKRFSQTIFLLIICVFVSFHLRGCVFDDSEECDDSCNDSRKYFLSLCQISLPQISPPKGIWLPITDQEVEGEWRDFFNNKVFLTPSQPSFNAIKLNSLKNENWSEDGAQGTVHWQRTKRGFQRELRCSELGLKVGRLDLRPN